MKTRPIQWDPKRPANMHHHYWSECLVLVQQGKIENTLDDGFHLEKTVYGPGEVFSNPIGVKHETRCLSEEGITLHVYTPKLVTEILPAPQETELLSLLALTNQRGESPLAGLSELLERLQSYLQQTNFSSDTPLQPTWYGHTATSLIAEKFSKHLASSARSVNKITSQITTLIEEEVSKIFYQQLQWEKSTCTSTSVAQQLEGHLLAMRSARQYQRLTFSDQGRAIIYLSAEVSDHFISAAKLVGYETSNLAVVKSDPSGKIDVFALEQLIKQHRSEGAHPFLVCGQMGSKTLGTIDDFSRIHEVCLRERLWFHVDACCATAALFSKKMSPLLGGIRTADSILFDTQARCAEAHDEGSALYLCAHKFERESALGLVPAKPHSLNLWALWKSIGASGWGEFVDRQIGLRDELLEWIKTQPRLELVATPNYLNLVLQVRPMTPGLKEKNLLYFSLMQTHLNFEHVTQVLERAQHPR